MTHILAIDDEPVILDLVALALSETDARVTLAATATDGIDLALRLRPDVVLLDLQLRGTSGEDVLAAIAGVADWHPHVVLFSAVHPEALREIAGTYGADAMSKPFDVDALERLAAPRELAA